MLIAIMIFSSGCLATGRKVSADAAAQIIPGKTSKNETLRLLGAPTSTISKNGKSVLCYWHQSPRATGNHKSVFSVLFSRDEIVERVHSFERDYQISNGNSRGGIISNKKELDEAVSTIVRGQTELRELIHRFNQPDDERLDVLGGIQRTWVVWDRYYSYNNELLATLTITCSNDEIVEDYSTTELLIR
jgi:hypothetical protein